MPDPTTSAAIAFCAGMLATYWAHRWATRGQVSRRTLERLAEAMAAHFLDDGATDTMSALDDAINSYVAERDNA